MLCCLTLDKMSNVCRTITYCVKLSYGYFTIIHNIIICAVLTQYHTIMVVDIMTIVHTVYCVTTNVSESM